MFGRCFCIGDFVQIVFGIFEVFFFLFEYSFGGIFGWLLSESMFVYVDSFVCQVIFLILKCVQQLCDMVMGGFDKVIVFGWNFIVGIGQQIVEFNDF